MARAFRGRKKRRFYAVLNLGPVVGSVEAVRVAIVAENKAEKG